MKLITNNNNLYHIITRNTSDVPLITYARSIINRVKKNSEKNRGKMLVIM